jgi:hypothetical protein
MATTLADDLKPLHHPKTWVGKYVWSQDHKVIAIQYGLTAISIGLEQYRAALRRSEPTLALAAARPE